MCWAGAAHGLCDALPAAMPRQCRRASSQSSHADHVLLGGNVLAQY
jgi:hypothetical protein